VDGIDIKDFDIHYLRSKFGVVSQEPVLFNGTFRENIKYNKYDATE
jgi:ATP-binding cassette subfamily B (MDR/TAP) protein 1